MLRAADAESAAAAADAATAAGARANDVRILCAGAGGWGRQPEVTPDAAGTRRGGRKRRAYAGPMADDRPWRRGGGVVWRAADAAAEVEVVWRAADADFAADFAAHCR